MRPRQGDARDGSLPSFLLSLWHDPGSSPGADTKRRRFLQSLLFLHGFYKEYYEREKMTTKPKLAWHGFVATKRDRPQKWDVIRVGGLIQP